MGISGFRFTILCLLLAGCGGGGSGGGGTGNSVLPLVADPVDFGFVGVGSGSGRRVIIDNPIDGADARITNVRRSSPDVEIGADLPGLPFTLAPGQRFSFTVTWTPAAEGPADETLHVDTDDRAPLAIRLSGEGFFSENTIDFGFVAFRAGTNQTAELGFDLDSDAISFTIEAAGGSRTSPRGGAIVLSSLTGPGGEVYVDATDPHAGPYLFERNLPSIEVRPPNALPLAPLDLATFAFPNTDRPDSQLSPGGGRYRFQLSNEGGALIGLHVRVLVERRTGGVAARGSIPLNVFLSQGLRPSAAQARTDPHIQAILARANAIFQQAGMGFGEISYFKLTGSAFDTGDPANPGPLVRNSSIAPEVRVNVFLVRRVLRGAAGVSAAIPGPNVNGTAHSGLIVLGDESFHPDDLGTILAHEICHYLGLGHSREFAGAAPWTHDIIDDTCPGRSCVGNPADYLMEPTALPPGPPLLTPGQIHVLLRNPLVNAAAPTFVRASPLTAQPLLAAPRETPPLRCATCDHASLR